MVKAEIIEAVEACIDALDDFEFAKNEKCPWCHSAKWEYQLGSRVLVHADDCQHQRAIRLGGAALTHAIVNPDDL